MKACRLVHIIPYTVNSHIKQITLFTGPPVTHLRIAKIRINRIPRPNGVHIHVSFRCLCKISIFYSFPVNIVVFIYFYPGINNTDCFKTSLFDFIYQFARLTIVFIIPCKNTVSVHIINIKMDGIARDFIFPVFFCNITYDCRRIIAPSGLLIA